MVSCIASLIDLVLFPIFLGLLPKSLWRKHLDMRVNDRIRCIVYIYKLIIYIYVYIKRVCIFLVAQWSTSVYLIGG